MIRSRINNLVDASKLTLSSKAFVGKFSTNACPALKHEESEVSFENAMPYNKIPKPSMLSFLPGGELFFQKFLKIFALKI